jgi:hypothetical protein
MSTTPPEQPTPSQRPSGPNVSFNVPATMPIPGNAELVVYILATIVLGIIALAADDFDASGFATIYGVITLGYLVSRGIAKASRVLER